MASNCITLSGGYEVPCIDGVGGLKNVYFIPWDDAQILSATTGEVAVLNTGVTAYYKYQLKNDTNTYVEDGAFDKNTRNSLYTGTLTLALAKVSLELSNELKMLSMSEIVAFVEDNEGNIFVVGNEYGALVTTNSMNLGAAKGDFNGFNLTIVSEERTRAPFLSPAAKADLKSKAVN